MCDDPIVSRDMIRAKARDAFNRGVKRNQHNMNPDAPALVDWLDEWDRCAAAVERAVLSVKPKLAQSGVTPP